MTTAARKPLTHHRQAEIAKPEAKPYSLNAGDGLFLEVTPEGAKYWRFRYSFDGMRKLISMGTFPATSLNDAKEQRDNARKLLRSGINPSDARKNAKAANQIAKANSFEAIAQEWLARQDDKAESTRDKASWLLQFAINGFGDKPIKDITPPMVLEVCRKIEASNRLETARRVRTKCGQVFRYAVMTGRAEHDPTADLRGALKPPQVKHRAAITEPMRIGQLLRDIDNYSGLFVTQCALKLAPLVFIRPGELRSARWGDIDLNAATWCFTPPKTRNQTKVEHIVPLASQAVAILRELQPLTGHRDFVFSSHGKSGHLSESAVLNALRRMGYSKDEMSGHGFRAIARTMLDERLKYRIDFIEQQLAHRVRDTHGRAYNRTKHMEERQEMMQAWADYLDKLRAGAEIIPIGRSA